MSVYTILFSGAARMKLFLDGHNLDYEMQSLCFAFFPGEPVTYETVKCNALQNTGSTASAATAAGAPSDKPPDDMLLGDGGDFVFTRIRRHSPTRILRSYSSAAAALLRARASGMP